MKYKDSFSGSREEFADFIKKSVPALFNGKMTVEGQNVGIPKDKNLDYTVKYDDDEFGGTVAIKVSWQEEEEEEEEVEVTEDDF